MMLKLKLNGSQEINWLLVPPKLLQGLKFHWDTIRLHTVTTDYALVWHCCMVTVALWCFSNLKILHSAYSHVSLIQLVVNTNKVLVGTWCEIWPLEGLLTWLVAVVFTREPAVSSTLGCGRGTRCCMGVICNIAVCKHQVDLLYIYTPGGLGIINQVKRLYIYK